jgi:hypothetical protein
MRVLAERAAPAWVPVVAFAVPVLIVGAVLIPAQSLELAPLKPARIGPSWKVPYGLGKSLQPSAGRGCLRDDAGGLI